MDWKRVFLTLFGMLFLTVTQAALVIGVPYFRPPYVIGPDDGYDLDVMKTICGRLHETCTFKFMHFDALYTALNNGTIDLAIGAINISASRKKHYIFTVPYKSSNGQFVVFNDSSINTVDELNGKKIGVVSGSVFEDYLKGNQQSKYTLVFFNGPVSLINALAQKKVDAVLIDSDGINFWQKSGGAHLKNVGLPIDVAGGFGIMAIAKNEALIRAINHIIPKLEKEGVYNKLYADYFGK